MTDKPLLMLIDGSGYIFRAYHALPPLTRRDGTPVGAVMGYCNMLLKLSDQLHADYRAVIFDAGRVTFRNEIYDKYKANRDETPEDLIPQFAIVREATDAMNVPRIESDGLEADDLIAAYAKKAVEAGMQVVIVSSDKDLMQLINDDVWLYDPMKNKPLREAEVFEKFGVTPDKVTHVQAMIGDSVDNVPGVPGIGPKTAAELIQTYGTLEELLSRASEIKQNKRRENLIEFADQARMSFELVTLKDDCDLPLELDALRRKEAEAETLLQFLQENQFKSLVARMESKFGVKAPQVELPPAPAGEKAPAAVSNAPAFRAATYALVSDAESLKGWVKKARAAGIVAVDTETDSLDATQASLVGVSLCVNAGEACYVPLGHVSGEGAADLFSTGVTLAKGQMDKAEALAILKPLLEDAAVLKVLQNAKYDLQMFRGEGIAVNAVDDTMLMSYVTASGLHGHGMDELSELHLNHKPIAYKDVVGTGRNAKNFSEITPEDARDYASEDADVTLRLHHVLKPQLRTQKATRVYELIERPLIDVIVAMEAEGIKVSPEKLKAMSEEFAQKMEGFEAEIYQLAGREFTIGSPKQLGEILFDELGIEGGKKSSKSGQYATDAQVLETLAAEGHAIAQKVLDWRQLSKLKSTYTDALQKQINPKTGRVHTSFVMTGAATGRLASSDPNLQNIPIRSEEGKRIREAFIAEKGCKLISADYSQIELRLLAEVADIAVLKDAFKHGRDIHAATASQMFGVPIDEVDSELRRRAKTINFGIIYGISAHGLATRLGIGRGEAADYIKAYFEQYPGIKDYMERTKEFAREHGYVETLDGRRVHVKEINAKNPNLRAFSERAAINAPLQGTAADIIKRAMRDVWEMLARDWPQAKLLLQVHDELIVEAPEAQAQQVADAVSQVMSAAAQLSVPLLVEAGVGDHWGEIH